MRHFIVAAALLLSACERTEARLDVADVNARNAIAKGQQNERQIRELEERIEDLEAEVEALRGQR